MDTLLERLFEHDRWERAIHKAYDKGVDKGVLARLCNPETRAALYLRFKEGRYAVAPPRTARIPKDKPGEYRTVYINEPADRVILAAINDLLFEACPDMVHPACMSYRRGIGTDRVVRQASRRITGAGGRTAGWKSDLSKYFDSVPIRFIDQCFDQVEQRTGKSAVISVLREYYHSDLYFNEDGEMVSQYQSLKQGCAPASFLADALLRHIDEMLSTRFGGFYRRFSDDMLFLGKNHKEAMACMQEELAKMKMHLNPDKVEAIDSDHWFTFLGYSIRGDQISISRKRLKTFTDAIKGATLRRYRHGNALRSVMRWLYLQGDHPWATQVLPTLTCKADIEVLNAYVLDCLRAHATGRRHTGGIGYNPTASGCLQRCTGRDTAINRAHTPKEIPGFVTLQSARNALLYNKAAFAALTAPMS